MLGIFPVKGMLTNNPLYLQIIPLTTLLIVCQIAGYAGSVGVRNLILPLV